MQDRAARLASFDDASVGQTVASSDGVGRIRSTSGSGMLLECTHLECEPGVARVSAMVVMAIVTRVDRATWG